MSSYLFCLYFSSKPPNDILFRQLKANKLNSLIDWPSELSPHEKPCRQAKSLRSPNSGAAPDHIILAFWVNELYLIYKMYSLPIDTIILNL